MKKITLKPKQETIIITVDVTEDIINKVVKAFKTHGFHSTQFKELYYTHFQLMEQHKIKILKENQNKPLNVYGYLIRRGDGEDKNLNLISPLWVNGTQIEHLHVYDGVIDVLNINSSGMFSSDNLEVFTYLRKDGSSAYGLKPVGESSYKYSARKK